MKIAYITAFEIMGPLNTGGVQCAYQNLNLLRQAFGEENIFVCAVTKNEELLSMTNGNITTFFSYPRKKIYTLINALSGRLMFSKGTERAILEHIRTLGCDAVYLDSSKMGFLQEQLPKDMKQILFMHNIERDYIKVEIRKQPEKLLLMRLFKRSETLAVKNADTIISLNNRDAARLKKYYGRSTDLILPMTMDDHFEEPEESTRSCNSMLRLLFVGSLFPPNQHGVTWFVREVMPHVNAEFTVVGRGFEKIAHKLNRDNVKVVGTVDDLSQYYYSADAVVSPILFGAGMKVKTAEAMMYGKPMFATDEALEGYDVEGRRNIYRCNSSKEFISAINAYAGTPPYAAFDPDIRSLFLQKYHTPSYIPTIRKLLLES